MTNDPLAMSAPSMTIRLDDRANPIRRLSPPHMVGADAVAGQKRDLLGRRRFRPADPFQKLATVGAGRAPIMRR